MSFIGKSPSVDRVRFTPLSADPVNPQNGDRFYSDGTARAEGLWIYKNGSWQQEASAGASGRLYFSDRDTTDISKFELYADAAAATPVDGTGGSPNVTKSLNTSTPLIGASSYRLSKDAANRQGEGAAVVTDIALDAPVTAGEPITVQFRYRTSANYASGDIRMFYYLVGDNELYALNGMDNLGNYSNELNAETTDRGQFTASLNATSSTTSIRIIAHIATTNASAYDVDFGEVTIGTAATLSAPIVTDWQEYTPTVTGAGTPGFNAFKYRRVGDALEIQGRFDSGTVSGAQAGVSLPPGLTILTGNGAREYVGTYIVSGANANQNKMGSTLADNATSVLRFGRSNYAIGIDAFGALNGNDVWVTGESVGIQATVKISEWANSSNIVSSTQAAFQTYKFKALRTTNQAIATAAFVQPSWDSVDDPFNSFSGGQVTIPKTGYYLINMEARAFNLDSNAFVVSLRINGNIPEFSEESGSAEQMINLNTLRKLNKGDTVRMDVNTSTDTSYTLSGNAVRWSIAEVPDLSVVGLAGQKSELVESRIEANANWPFSINTYGDFTSIVLTPGEWDITGMLVISAAGSPGARVAIRMGISSAAGDTASGLDFGYNEAFVSFENAADVKATPVIPRYNVTVTATTTFYLKALMGGSVANMRYEGYSISARRIR